MFLQVKDMKFTFNLTKEDGSDEFNGIKLNRFAMQELAGNVCYVTFRPPEKASYLLVIYAKDYTDKVLCENGFVLMCSRSYERIEQRCSCAVRSVISWDLVTYKWFID